MLLFPQLHSTLLLPPIDFLPFFLSISLFIQVVFNLRLAEEIAVDHDVILIRPSFNPDADQLVSNHPRVSPIYHTPLPLLSPFSCSLHRFANFVQKDVNPIVSISSMRLKMREYPSVIVLQLSIITTSRYDQKALDGFGVIRLSLRQQTSLDSTGKCSMKHAKVSGHS